MGLWQLNIDIQLLWQSVAVALQDGLNLFEPVKPLGIGDFAGFFQTFRWILPAEIEQTQADTIGLLGVRFAAQLITHPRQYFAADIFGPVFNRPGVHCWCF